MPIEQELTECLKQAMKARDQATLDVVRMLKTRVQERRTAKGFSGEITDEIMVEILGAYRRQLEKAMEEFEKSGERGAAQREKLRFEIAFCERWLPARLGEEEVRALVRERIAALGVTDARQAGRVVGDVMKTHKGQVDATAVKRAAEEILAAG